MLIEKFFVVMKFNTFLEIANGNKGKRDN